MRKIVPNTPGIWLLNGIKQMPNRGKGPLFKPVKMSMIDV